MRAYILLLNETKMQISRIFANLLIKLRFIRNIIMFLLLNLIFVSRRNASAPAAFDGVPPIIFSVIWQGYDVLKRIANVIGQQDTQMLKQLSG